MAKQLDKAIDWRQPLRLILRKVAPVWPFWLSGIVLSLGMSIAMIGIATVQKDILDLIATGHLDRLYRVLFMWGGGLATAVLVGCFGQFLINYGSALAVRLFRRELLGHANSLTLTACENRHSGDIVSRVHNDTAQALNYFCSNVAVFVSAMLTAALTFIYLSRINLGITIFITATGPLLFVLGRFFDKRLRILGRDLQQNSAAIRSLLQEQLQSMELIRAYGLEQWAMQRFLNLRQKMLRLSLRQVLTSRLLEVLNESISLLVMLTTCLAVAVAAVRGELSTGTLLAFVILVNRLTMPFINASNMWGNMQQAFSAARRVLEVLEQPVEVLGVIGESTGKAQASEAVATPALELEHVTYHYGQETELFNDLTFSIAPGEVVGLVGGSGAGKTTVARLALGLYQPLVGCVRVCGYDTRTSLAAARERTAYVPQSPFLFNDTIYANVTCGFFAAPAAVAGEIGLSELAAQLPDGIETMVGEKGTQLSGGQRQRVALARAMLRRPGLLVLDEATSALDNETEQDVQQILAKNKENAGVLVIAHRLTTVAGCDRIIVLENGRLVEQGTHAALLATGGVYAQLWRAVEAENIA